MKPHLVLRPGEVLVSIAKQHLTDMQFHGSCDECLRALPKDTRVLGKVLNIRGGTLLGSRFSPTCLACMNYN